MGRGASLYIILVWLRRIRSTWRWREASSWTAVDRATLSIRGLGEAERGEEAVSWVVFSTCNSSVSCGHGNTLYLWGDLERTDTSRAERTGFSVVFSYACLTEVELEASAERV